MRRISPLFVVLVAALAGCGGSGSSVVTDPGSGGGTIGGGSGGGGGPIPNPLTDKTLTNPVLLPTTGAVVYDGQMVVNLETAANTPGQTTPYAGDFALTANFVTGAVTGRASGLETGTAAPMLGTLYLTLGTIDRAAAGTRPTYEGLISGALKEGNVNYVLHGDFTGDFVGQSPLAVRGSVAGDSIRTGRTAPFTGTFSAR